jgi:WD40 repeat protein
MINNFPTLLALAGVLICGCIPSSDVEFIRAPLKDLGELRRFVGHDEAVHSLAVSKDGTKLLSCCGCSEILNGKPVKVADLSIRLWDIQTGKELLKLEGHTATITCVDFSPDGKTAVSGSNDGTIRFWNLETGKEILSLTAYRHVKSVGYFSDGKRIYAGGLDQTAGVWEIETKNERRAFEVQYRGVYAVGLSPDEKQIFVIGDNQIWNWVIQEETLLHQFPTKAESQVIEVTPETKRIVRWMSNGVATLDIPIETSVDKFVSKNTLSTAGKFTSDGKYFVSCGGHQLQVWDVRTGEEVAKVEGFPDVLKCLALTPDNKHVIVSGGNPAGTTLDFTIRMWSLEDLLKKRE